MSSIVVILVYTSASNWLSAFLLTYCCQIFESLSFLIGGRWNVSAVLFVLLVLWNNFSHAYDPFTLPLCEISVYSLCLFFLGFCSFSYWIPEALYILRSLYMSCKYFFPSLSFVFWLCGDFFFSVSYCFLCEWIIRIHTFTLVLIWGMSMHSNLCFFKMATLQT